MSAITSPPISAVHVIQNRGPASGLPVGAPPGLVARRLRGMPPFSGTGRLYLSADGDDSVIALRRDDE
jgi:hypothetical protein